MGLWDKLMGEFVDVIEWTDDSSDTMVYRFERHGNEIKFGAKLTVRESQVAIFVNEGEVADVLTPGMYVLETQNLPRAFHPATLGSRLPKPVQGRSLLLQHQAVHQPEMGNAQPGDDPRQRIRRGAGTGIWHVWGAD